MARPASVPDMTEAARGKKVRVLRWGPYPGQGQVFGGGIGGYARYNSQALRSSLADEVDLIPLPMTVPRFQHPALFWAHLFYRMLKDVLVVSWGLLRQRPDVLHITALYWRSIYREWWATWLASLLGIPVFYDIRAGTFVEFAERGSGLGRWCTGDIMRRASQVAIQGRQAAETISRLFDREVLWLPNCFLERDLKRYPPADLRRPAVGEPLRLVFLGYLIPEKGVDVLLEVAERLSGELPVQVTLIGEVAPSFAATLERFMARQHDAFKIVATGRLEFAEVLEHLRQQHLFVFLSRFFGEGHPNAINEAMAVGLPVIVSRQGFLADIVNSECGVVVEDARDVQAIVTLIRELCADWDRLIRMGSGARRRMETTFSDATVLRKTLAVYQALGSCRPSRSRR